MPYALPAEELSMLDFQSMFSSAKSMAIVGSSPSVEQWDNGEYIDSHDIVVRFNRATTEGFERHVGSRTDIVVANEANNLSKAPSPADTVAPKCVVLFVKPNAVDGKVWQEPFFDWVGETPIFISMGPEILSCDVPSRRRGFSMGTYSLAGLPHYLSIEKLFVTGFTMFGAVPGGAHHYCKKTNQAAVTWHDADLERQVMANLLGNTDCDLTVTEEVASIMTSEGFSAHLLQVGSEEIATSKQRSGFKPGCYLLGRLSKLMLTLGFILRRVAERRRAWGR